MSAIKSPYSLFVITINDKNPNFFVAVVQHFIVIITLKKHYSDYRYIMIISNMQVRAVWGIGWWKAAAFEPPLLKSI